MNREWNLAIPIGMLVVVATVGTFAVANAETGDSRMGFDPVASPIHLRPDPRERFVNAAVDHPGGFGGWYIENDVVFVYMDDPTADPVALFGEIYAGDPPDLPIVAVQGNHSYNELLNWARQINEANRGYVTLSMESIRLDLNRIEYGVLTVEEIEPTVEWIESIGVPRTAFEVRLDQAKPDFDGHR